MYSSPLHAVCTPLPVSPFPSLSSLSFSEQERNTHTQPLLYPNNYQHSSLQLRLQPELEKQYTLQRDYISAYSQELRCRLEKTTLKSLLKAGTNFGKFWQIQKNCCVCKKTND